AGLDEVARRAGVAYALAGLARAQRFHETQGRIVIPPGSSAADTVARATSLMRGLPRTPRFVLPACLPASLVRVYSRSLTAEVTRFEKQRAVAWAMLRGRL